MLRGLRLAFALVVFAAVPTFAAEPPAVSELVVGECYEIRVGDAALEQRLTGTLLLQTAEWTVFEDVPLTNARPEQRSHPIQRWIPTEKVHVLGRLGAPRVAPTSAPKPFQIGELVLPQWATAAGAMSAPGKLKAIDANRLSIEFEGTVESHHGVAFLCDLPLVGHWFRWKKSGTTQNKHDIPREDLLCVMVFARPEVAATKPGARNNLK